MGKLVLVAALAMLSALNVGALTVVTDGYDMNAALTHSQRMVAGAFTQGSEYVDAEPTFTQSYTPQDLVDTAGQMLSKEGGKLAPLISYFNPKASELAQNSWEEHGLNGTLHLLAVELKKAVLATGALDVLKSIAYNPRTASFLQKFPQIAIANMSAEKTGYTSCINVGYQAMVSFGSKVPKNSTSKAFSAARIAFAATFYVSFPIPFDDTKLQYCVGGSVTLPYNDAGEAATSFVLAYGQSENQNGPSWAPGVGYDFHENNKTLHSLERTNDPRARAYRQRTAGPSVPNWFPEGIGLGIGVFAEMAIPPAFVQTGVALCWNKGDATLDASPADLREQVEKDPRSYEQTFRYLFGPDSHFYTSLIVQPERALKMIMNAQLDDAPSMGNLDVVAPKNLEFWHETATRNFALERLNQERGNKSETLFEFVKPGGDEVKPKFNQHVDKDEKDEAQRNYNTHKKAVQDEYNTEKKRREDVRMGEKQEIEEFGEEEKADAIRRSKEDGEFWLGPEFQGLKHFMFLCYGGMKTFNIALSTFGYTHAIPHA